MESTDPTSEPRELAECHAASHHHYRRYPHYSAGLNTLLNIRPRPEGTIVNHGIVDYTSQKSGDLLDLG
jgi:hypothetical protein